MDIKSHDFRAAFNQHGVGYKREQVEYNMKITFPLM